MQVVIAQSPSVDTSIVVGPFQSTLRALDAANDLQGKGYNTEIAPLFKLSEVDYSPPWDE